MRSVFEEIKSQVAVRPQAASAAVTSAAIDTAGFRSLMVTVENGAATGTPSSYTVDAKVQECATSGGSYTDISGAAITQISADNKSAQIRVDGLGTNARKRYIKVVVTPALTGGSTPKALVAANVLFGVPQVAPVSNSATGA
jgi:hypothetical protein